MSSPQVKSKSSSNQASTSPTSTQTAHLSWEEILKSAKITKEHVEYAITHIEDAPQLPVEFVYSQFTDIKISPPTTIAISGSGGVIGAILVLRHVREVRYFATTKEVINADEKSPLSLSKYTLELLKRKYNTEIITIELNQFETIKLLLKQGGIYISGLPYELVIEAAQLAGFGRLWHFSNINRKFYVF